jgi:hypothetical protein
VKRFGAAVLAVTMVVVSLMIRSRIDDDDNGSGSSTGTTNDRPVVMCITELADACHQAFDATADVHVEEAINTAKAIAKGGAAIDAWVTFSGWPELLAAKGASPTLSPTPVASTPLVIAAVKQRAEVLDCKASGWSCLLAAAGEPWTGLGGLAEWGAVKVGIPRATSAAGLLLEASAITGYANTIDVGTNDQAYSDARALLSHVEQDANAFTSFTVQLPARFSFVGALQVDVATRAGTKADQITTLALQPPASAIAVVARPGKSTRVDPTKLTKPLQGAGWTVPPVPSSGLPEGGLLLALSGIS